MEPNKVGYIYITTNNINNKKYIGKRTKSYFDTNYYGSGKHLRRAINKYGKDNFSVEILEWCYSLNELNEAERKWIKHYSAQTSAEFYNISEGGDWGDVSKGMSPEEKTKWGEKISRSNTGKKRTLEQRQHISESLKGKSKKLSKEAIEKRKGKGNHRYGKKWSDEERKKLSDSSVTKKPVIMEFKGEKIEFPSVIECYKFLHDKYNISKFLVKKILRENVPYKLKGKCANQKTVKQIEGMRIYYL